MSDELLIVRINGFNLSSDKMLNIQKKFCEQKETGVIILPWFCEVLVVPKDIEIKALEEGPKMEG